MHSGWGSEFKLRVGGTLKNTKPPGKDGLIFIAKRIPGRVGALLGTKTDKERPPGRLDSGVKWQKIDRVHKPAVGSVLQGLQGSGPSQRGCTLAGEVSSVSAVVEL